MFLRKSLKEFSVFDYLGKLFKRCSVDSKKESLY